MIKPNSQNSNHQLLDAQKDYSNTQLNDRKIKTLSTNSFNPSLPTQLDSHLSLTSLPISLDYLRFGASSLRRKNFDLLTTILFSQVDCKAINKPWHPDPKMPKNKKYQNRIVSRKGIVFGYTKRAKYRGVNTRYVYDIMIDFTGAYLANLSLLEQIKLIQYISNYFKLECHRIDIAVDDYSRKLFPVNQMIIAYLNDCSYGFQVIDDSYLDIIDNKLVGTLGIGSRLSSFFVRIYTKHQYFIRWETELKKKKAKSLFDKLSSFDSEDSSKISFIKSIQIALIEAAMGDIDFRDNSVFGNRKYARKSKTNRLSFWENTLNTIFSFIENKGDSNHLKSSQIKA